MPTETEPALNAQVASELLDWLRGAKEFVAEQAPLLAQDILSYGAIVHWVSVAALGVLTVAFVAATLGCGYLGNRTKNDPTDYVAGFFIFGSCGAFTLGFFINSALTLVQIYYAPRLYLIEQLSELIK